MQHTPTEFQNDSISELHALEGENYRQCHISYGMLQIDEEVNGQLQGIPSHLTDHIACNNQQALKFRVQRIPAHPFP